MRLGLLILFSMLLVSCAGEPPVNLNIGQPAPAFRSALASGGTLAFPVQENGQPVLLMFWAEWCPGCLAEMKAVEAIHPHLRDKGLRILAVNVGQSAAEVRAFVEPRGIRYPVLLDETSAITRRYGVVALPTAFLIDTQGIVRGKIVGEVSMETLASQLRAVLE